MSTPVRWVAVEGLAGCGHRKRGGSQTARAVRRRVPCANASSCAFPGRNSETIRPGIDDDRRETTPFPGTSPGTGGWKRMIGTAAGAAALSACARAPQAAFAAPTVPSPLIGVQSSKSSPFATENRRASPSSSALLRRLPGRANAAHANANVISETSFLPALVLPRSGWFVGSWIAGNAGFFQKQFEVYVQKFCTNWVAYATIPLVAGVLNWFTNALAVTMIFSPEEYFGLSLKRWPETPFGLFGWQGIVPCKVRKMSSTMVDLMTSRLLDVREVFGRLDRGECGNLLEPGIDAITQRVVTDLLGTEGDATESKTGSTVKGNASPLPKWASAVVAALPLAATLAARDLARKHGRVLVSAVLLEMQTRVPEVWDVKTQVVGAMTRDKKIIVELFRRCGRNEFVFIRRSGLYFGFLFGIFQMLQWLVWDPWWSLAVGGAVVGYATNWLALTLMFSPVHPKTFGPFTLHGAFLRRQSEVSGEFAEMLRSRVLSAENIWGEILGNEVTSPMFFEILERKTREQLAKARTEEKAVGCFANLIGAKRWSAIEETVVNAVLADLPKHLPLVYAYSDQALDLETTLRDKMRALSPEEFEGVLHPVFQEDELTLILVGAFLGLVAGFLQAAAF